MLPFKADSEATWSIMSRRYDNACTPNLKIELIAYLGYIHIWTPRVLCFKSKCGLGKEFLQLLVCNFKWRRQVQLCD